MTVFLQTLYRSAYQEGVVLGLKLSKFCQLSTELWPLIYVTISFLGSILSIFIPIFFKLCKGVHIWNLGWGDLVL